MRITAIMNLKGGVAKTTTVVNMAAILAAKGSKVLVIDGDAQCNATEFLGGSQTKPGLAELLRGECSEKRPAELQHTTVEGVDLIGANESLMDLDLSKVEGGDAKVNCLKEVREILEQELPADFAKAFPNPYDYCLIDCPTAFSAATAAALLAADDVIIPMKLDAFSIRGMSVLFRQIENMRQINPDLTIAGILPTMWYKSPETEQIENEILRAGLPVFHHIRLSKTVDRMTLAQRPLQEISRNSGALRDYRFFVDQYISREVH